MTRKPYQESQDHRHSQDRWLISYADFITLMFALFAALYAMTIVENHNKLIETVNKTEAEPTTRYNSAIGFNELSLASSLFSTLPSDLANNRSSATTEKISPQASNSEPQTKQLLISKEQAQIDSIVEQLQQNLASMIERGTIHINKSTWGVSVVINASILFTPANAKLNPQSQQTLGSIATILKNQTHKIRVEGYTDDKPINTAIYPSNWELSSARASGVVRFLIEHGIADNRLAALGYAGTHPIGDNKTGEGRMKNRRVQLMILANPAENLDPLSNSENSQPITAN